MERFFLVTIFGVVQFFALIKFSLGSISRIHEKQLLALQTLLVCLILISFLLCEANVCSIVIHQFNTFARKFLVLAILLSSMRSCAGHTPDYLLSLVIHLLTYLS